MKRILLIVIALAAVICFASCGKEEKPADGTTSQTAAEDIVIASKGECDYTIIMPDSSFGKVRTAASDLQMMLENFSGTKVPLVKESEGNFELEIIFGETGRPETTRAKELLGDNDFIMMLAGKKLVLLGKNDECLSYLPSRINALLNGEKLSVPEGFCSVEKVGVVKTVENVKANDNTSVEFDFRLLAAKSKFTVFFGTDSSTSVNGYLGFSVDISSDMVVFNRQGQNVTEYARKKMTVTPNTDYKGRFEFIGNYCRFYLIDDMEGVEPWPEFELNIGEKIGESTLGYVESNGYGAVVTNFKGAPYENEDLSGLTFKNPLNGDGADPDVLKVDDTYYLFFTGGGYPTFSSEDLVHWKKIGTAVPNGGWGVNKNFWAPDTEIINGKYYMAVSFGEDGFGIASARKPEGPYVVQGTEPLLRTTIDGHIFVDDDGQIYLYYTSWYKGRTYGIYGVRAEFDSKGNLIPVWETETLLLTPGAEWEKMDGMGPVIEAPYMLKHNGKYYLVYSATHTGSIHYAVGYAVSDYPIKSFKKYVNNPILSMTSDVHCTGHCCIVEAPDGSMCILYHCANNLNSIYPRKTCIDKIRFSPTPSGVDRLEVYGPTSMRHAIDWME